MKKILDIAKTVFVVVLLIGMISAYALSAHVVIDTYAESCEYFYGGKKMPFITEIQHKQIKQDFLVWYEDFYREVAMYSILGTDDVTTEVAQGIQIMFDVDEIDNELHVTNTFIDEIDMNSYAEAFEYELTNPEAYSDQDTFQRCMFGTIRSNFSAFVIHGIEIERKIELDFLLEKELE